MTLVFDTSILIAIQRGEKEAISKLKELSKTYPIPAQISFMTYYEYLKGLKINKPKKYNELIVFLNHFRVLKTTKATAEIMANLKIKYDSKGIAFSLADLFIASQALENQLILVTKDKSFEKIEELKKIIFQ